MQTSVALSTAEAEYLAASSAAREAQWLKRLCHELGVGDAMPVPMHMDNQSAIHMSNNDALSSKTKHIGVASHFLKDMIAKYVLRTVFVRTDGNVADIFTKCLPRDAFQRFRTALGVV
jgi:hypothetical protein